MNIAKLIIILLGAITLCCATAQPGAAQIVPCGKSDDPDVRSKKSEAGVRCRKDNINLYLKSLKYKGSYSSVALKECLEKMRDELQGYTRHKGAAGKRGAGKNYYTQLEKCRTQAQREKRGFNLDSATADNDADSDPVDADCDAKCADRFMAKFMTSTPEPEPAGEDDEDDDSDDQ
jgi:hypothetical protein